MQAAVHNKVKVYNLTVGKSLPEWLAERKKNKKSAMGEQRIELIHDLEFPDFARCVFRTPNGSHLFAAGDYPPRIRCFDVNQLSMKFEFNADMPILGGVSLSPDYRKFALRGEGREITVHNTAIILDRVRVPHIQRCLTYHENTCDLLSGGASADIVRFNLDAGAFNESYTTKSASGINTLEPFSGHGLIMAGCDNGVVEAWDPRAHTNAGLTNVAAAEGGQHNFGPSSTGEVGSVTSIATDSNGLLFACGTSNGQVALYDIRLNKPIVVKDHMTSLPIVKTYFFQGRSNTSGERTHIISADKRAIKVWNKHDGSNFTTLETPAEIYDFTVLKAQHNLAAPYECDDSGIIAIACDMPRVQVQFVPALGIAPKWASFLDNITEELEASDTTVVYEDYKFISKEEMDAYGISAADITDGRVRPAMHGAYIENKLYRELKAVVDPSALARHTMEQQKKQMLARTSNRISKFTKKETPEEANMSEADKRFTAKLKDPAFAVDERNQEYSRLLHTLEAKKAKEADRRRRYDDAQFTVVPADPNDFNDDDGDDNQTSEAIEKQYRGRPTAVRRSSGGKNDAGGKRSRSAASDGVVFQEAKEGAKFASTVRQGHEYRKAERAKKMSLSDRLASQTKKKK